MWEGMVPLRCETKSQNELLQLCEGERAKRATIVYERHADTYLHPWLFLLLPCGCSPSTAIGVVTLACACLCNQDETKGNHETRSTNIRRTQMGSSLTRWPALMLWPLACLTAATRGLLLRVHTHEGDTCLSTPVSLAL